MQVLFNYIRQQAYGRVIFIYTNRRTVVQHNERYGKAGVLFFQASAYGLNFCQYGIVIHLWNSPNIQAEFTVIGNHIQLCAAGYEAGRTSRIFKQRIAAGIEVLRYFLFYGKSRIDSIDPFLRIGTVRCSAFYDKFNPQRALLAYPDSIIRRFSNEGNGCIERKIF